MFRLLYVLFLLPLFASAQTATIPGFTGYAVPAEQDESGMFSKERGAVWTNPRQELQYFFHTIKGGTVQLGFHIANVKAGTILQIQLGSTVKKITPGSTVGEKLFLCRW